jgi:hypothetical protein
MSDPEKIHLLEGSDMNQIPSLDLFCTLSGEQASGRARMPAEIGEDIFKTFLKEESASVTERGKAENSVLPSDEAMGTGRKGVEGSFLEKMGEWIDESGFLGSDLKLSPEAVPQLVSMLEKAGLKREEIDLLVERSTDKAGFLHLNRLWRQLKESRLGREGSAGDQIVRSGEIPLIQEALFKTGLGVGEVKAVTEKAVNREGDLGLESFQRGLSETLSGRDLQIEARRLLSSLGIGTEGKSMGDQVNGQVLKDLFSRLGSFPDSDLEQKIKEKMAGLLREKGVPPEQVKSFLETLSVDKARSIANPLDGLPKGKRKLGESSILDHVRITPRNAESKTVSQVQARIGAESKGEKGSDPFSGAHLTDQKGRLDGDPLANVLRLKGRDDLQSELQQGTKTGTPVLGGKDSEKFQQTIQHAVQENQAATRADQRVTESGGLREPRASYPLPEPLPRIMNRMIWMSQAGQQRSRIQLSPPELGRLDVSLMVDHGHLRAHIGAESLWVKEIIDSNLVQLKQQLSGLGFVVDQFDVMVGLGQGKSGGNDDLWSSKGKNGPSWSKRDDPNVSLTGEKGVPRLWGEENYQINVRV